MVKLWASSIRFGYCTILTVTQICVCSKLYNCYTLILLPYYCYILHQTECSHSPCQKQWLEACIVPASWYLPELLLWKRHHRNSIVGICRWSAGAVEARQRWAASASYNKVYIWECLFVCLFVRGKDQKIDAKCSGITKNDPESVLRGSKSPVSVFSGRYRDISGFSFPADRHLSPFHFWLLPRLLLTQSAFAKTAANTCHIATDNSSD